MKKILGTILVAVAFVAVNIDAKRMTVRGQGQSQPAAVANVVQAAKNAEQNPTDANKSDLVNTLEQEADTDAKQETIDLKVEENKLVEGIKIVEQRMKDLNYGLFGFWTDADTKKAYSAAKDRLNDLKAELKTVRSKLNANKQETGSKWTAAVDYAIKSLKYVGIPVIIIGGVAYDLYYGKGYTQGAMTEVRSGLPRTRAAAGRAYTAGKGYASSAYESGKGMARGAYNKLPNVRRTQPVVETPAVETPVVETRPTWRERMKFRSSGYAD